MKKRIYGFLCAIIVALSAIPAFADSSWKVPVKLMNAHDTSKESMANQALQSEAEVIVGAHSSKITIYLQPMQIGTISENINKLFIVENDRRIEATKTPSGQTPYDTKLTFESASVKPKEVKVVVWVNAMDALQGGKEGAGEQTAILMLDWDKAVEVKAQNTALATTPTNGIHVTVSGKAVSFDTQPISKDGRILVPLRAIFEALEAEVKWDAATKTVTATKDGKTLSLTVNKSEAKVSDGTTDTAIKLDVPASMQNGRIYVPLRFIGEAFGNKVDFQRQGSASLISIV